MCAVMEEYLIRCVMTEILSVETDVLRLAKLKDIMSASTEGPPRLHNVSTLERFQSNLLEFEKFILKIRGSSTFQSHRLSTHCSKARTQVCLALTAPMQPIQSGVGPTPQDTSSCL